MESDDLCYWTLYKDCLEVFGHLMVGAVSAVVLKKLRPENKVYSRAESDAYIQCDASDKKEDIKDDGDAKDLKKADTDVENDNHDSGVEDFGESDSVGEYNEVTELKAEIAKLKNELAQVKEYNAQWMQSYANLEAELNVAREEKNALAKENEDVKAELAKSRAVKLNQTTELADAQKMIDELNKKLNDAKDVLGKNNEYTNKLCHENQKLRYELDRQNYTLYMRDTEFDDVHGRLMAARYYVNYLQNRPEFQSIPKTDFIPPDMRRSPPKTGQEKPKKKVRFADIDSDVLSQQGSDVTENNATTIDKTVEVSSPCALGVGEGIQVHDVCAMAICDI